MPPRQASVVGLQHLERNFIVARERFDRVTKRWVDSSVPKLERQVKRNASLTDHSLPDLARLGHPYARQRHPGGIRADLLGHEAHQVHKQSGTLFGSIGSRKGRLFDRFVGEVFVDESRAPHARYVIKGTIWMHPRDFLNISLQEIAAALGADLIAMFKGEVKAIERVGLRVSPGAGGAFEVEAVGIGAVGSSL